MKPETSNPDGQVLPAAKSRKRGVLAYTENPFVETSTVTTRRKRTVVVKGNKAIVDGETGQVEDMAEIVMVREVDDEQFVKLFTQNLRIFFDLTPGTLKLLQVVLHQVQKTPNHDQIMLNLAVVEDYFTRAHLEPMSKASFHRAVHELLDKKFIAESVLTGLYFINHHLFFNGDRVRFVQEFRRKRANATHADQVKSLNEHTLQNDPRQVPLLAEARDE
jgi:hypothetical protein